MDEENNKPLSKFIVHNYNKTFILTPISEISLEAVPDFAGVLYSAVNIWENFGREKKPT